MNETQSIGARIKERNIFFKGGDFLTRGGGFTQVPNVILVDKDLSVGAKLTYAMLLKYAWYDDHCFPGQDKLAEDMGVGKRSVVTFIKELQTADLIEVERRGLGKPNVYHLNMTIRR